MDDSGQKQPKRALGTIRQAAIVIGQIAAGADVIEVEGVEDLLCVLSVGGARAGFAACGAANLGKPTLPPGCRVTIVADNGPGEVEARKAALVRVQQGQHVRLAIPPQGCKDANELLVSQGPEAVRAMIAEAVEVVPGDGRLS